MNRMFAFSRQTFAALAIPNYRRYFTGQAISLIGTWMQTIAQSWLIFKLTGSATDVGWAVALQTLPVLVLGPYGGVVADRIDKRKLMMVLQSMMGVLASRARAARRDSQHPGVGGVRACFPARPQQLL